MPTTVQTRRFVPLSQVVVPDICGGVCFRTIPIDEFRSGGGETHTMGVDAVSAAWAFLEEHLADRRYNFVDVPVVLCWFASRTLASSSCVRLGECQQFNSQLKGGNVASADWVAYYPLHNGE